MSNDPATNIDCPKCGISHSVYDEECPIVLSRVEFPCPTCPTLRSENAALRERIALLERVVEAAEDIDELNGEPAHMDYCDWQNDDGTECVCGMNELRAALSAAGEGK